MGGGGFNPPQVDIKKFHPEKYLKNMLLAGLQTHIWQAHLGLRPYRVSWKAELYLQYSVNLLFSSIFGLFSNKELLSAQLSHLTWIFFPAQKSNFSVSVLSGLDIIYLAPLLSFSMCVCISLCICICYFLSAFLSLSLFLYWTFISDIFVFSLFHLISLSLFWI